MSGFVYCTSCRGRHWGRRGASGLLLVSGAYVLLTLRSPFVHQGNTWSIPGGALDAGETPEGAAVREACEELAGLSSVAVHSTGAQHVDDHGSWSYTTVLATVAGRPPLRLRNRETTAARWTPAADVEHLDHLHPAFARSWPHLASLLLLEETR